MILNIALGIVMLSVLLVSIRVLRGPTWGDRIMAFDFLSINLVVLFTLISVQTSYIVMLDAALVLSLLGFLSTVALTRYLLLGRVFTPTNTPNPNNQDAHLNNQNEQEFT